MSDISQSRVWTLMSEDNILEEGKQYENDTLNQDFDETPLQIRNELSEDEDDDDTEAFLFKSSLKVGSSFLNIETFGSSNTEPNIEDESETFFHHPSPLCILSNTTSETIVGFYVYSNANGFLDCNYKLKNYMGFLTPGQSVKVRTKRKYNTPLSELTNISNNEEDMLMVKAMPISEDQINKDNIHEYSDLKTVFNKYNIDLMFTLSAITVKVRPCVLKKTQKKSISRQNKKKVMKKDKENNTNVTNTERGVNKYEFESSSTITISESNSAISFDQ
mmetsp:Transcript_6510/g.5588  ORF Transcript_6510/g.5588 Transcript_6510/m.5588 type:complete len:276 (+) Transcript_6510:3-830(+)